MFNRYGLLVKSDRSENQDTKKDPELQNILNSLYISDSEKFVSDLTGWTIYGSTNRCYFYMKFGYQNKGYAQQNQPISYDGAGLWGKRRRCNYTGYKVFESVSSRSGRYGRE